MILPQQQRPKLVITQTIRAALALGIRQVAVQCINLLGGVILARLLSPKDFGIYAITIFILNFLISFGGSGIAANLIRRPEEPTIEDYRTVFSFQQAIVLGLCLILWLAAPIIAVCYNLPPSSKWIFRLIAAAFLITSFMVVPEVKLERQLRFDKLALVEISQTLVFYTLTIFMAWYGYGAFSFAVALVFRAIIGALVVNLLSPWNLSWEWDWHRVRKHLSFGLSFQGALFVSLLKDSITPIFIGIFLGMQDVGYINWAQMVAAYPVLVLMSFQRIYLPAFAKMQSHRTHLSSFVEHVILITNAITAPLAVVTFVLITPITEIVFGVKWLEALDLFYLLWIANIFVPTATPLLGLLNAIGCSHITFRFTVIWMLGTWLLGVPFIWFLGSIGFALANVIVQLTNLSLYRIAKNYVPFNINILPIWFISICSGLLLLLINNTLPITSKFQLVFYCFTFIAFNMLLFLAIYRKKISSAIQWVREYD